VWSDADRAALESALRLRDDADAQVQIEVAAVGPPALGQMLRKTLNLGVDRVRLVVTPAEEVAPDRAAAALMPILRASTFDLVLIGAAATDRGEGLVGWLTAEASGRPLAGTAAHVAVQASSEGGSLLLVSGDGRRHVRALPAAVALEAGLALRPFTIDGYLTAGARQVEAVPWPQAVAAIP